MAEIDMMEVYQFSPNAFDKILEDFSRAVADGNYAKLNYSNWRRLKTSKWSIKIVIRIDLVGKFYFTIYPNAYGSDYFICGADDDSFGEYLIDNIDYIFTDEYKVFRSKEFSEYKQKMLEKNNNIKAEVKNSDYIKVYDKDNGWNTEFSCSNSITDEELKKIIMGAENTATASTVINNTDSAITGKASNKSLTWDGTKWDMLTSVPTLTDAIATIKDKCVTIDDEYVNSRIHKAIDEALKEQNTFNNDDNKKGNKKMKAFNFDFGPCTNDNIRMSMYGLAVKNANGTWVSYNPESKEIIDVDIFNFDGGKFLYKMPVAIKDVAPGDIVIHNRKAMFVIDVSEAGMTAIDPQAGEEKKILLTKSPFNFNFATKVVSLFNMTSNAPTPDAPFGNMLPFLMMSENGGEFDMNTVLMLSMMGGQPGMDFSKNPMMMYFLMKDSKNADDLLPLMFMGNLCK